MYNKYWKAEEDRHPNIIDFNHVLSKNSTFLFENFDNLKKSFTDNHKEEWSPIEPALKTDKVAAIMTEELYPKYVVDANGKFIGGKPFFIHWPKWFRMNDHMSAYSL